MQILGNYKSQLTTFHYQQLVTLLQDAIKQGDYAAGATFDQTALQNLQAQGQAFTTLPQPSAGQRVTDQSINLPLGLLAARFSALLNESKAFDAGLVSLLDVLAKDTALIDQLLIAGALESWTSSIPSLGGNFIRWDFGTGFGPVADSFTSLWTDPVNGGVYNSRPPLATVLTDVTHTGLLCDSTINTVPIKNTVWKFDPGNALVEELYMDTWSKLTLLSPEILINFNSQPGVTPGDNPFIVTGRSTLGALPVYVQTSFTPRNSQKVIPLTAGTPVTLTGYNVSVDDVFVFIGEHSYTQIQDFTVSDTGILTPISSDFDGTKPVTIYFVEYYPSYRCSIDQKTWSPLIMFDTVRPYSDSETVFSPIAFGSDSAGNKLLPITDELGAATGMYIQLGTLTPAVECLLEIICQASQDTVGATAVLEVDLSKFGYLNALEVTPFTTFPLTLKRIETQGLTTYTRKTVWSGSEVISRPTVLRFPTDSVATVFLTFYQQNYSIKQQTVTPPDALRRDVMSQLQAILPFSARRTPPSVPVVYTGVQYEFGLEKITGQLWSSNHSVFVSGPNRIQGCPDLLRFDASVSGPVDFYLGYQAYGSGDQIVDENLTGISISNGQCLIFPFATILDRSQVASVDLFIRMIHRSSAAVVERYLVQVTNV